MGENKKDILLNPGDRVGAYKIERSIGSGGMAEVYYAVHEGLERPAAIKVLKASLAADDTHLQRFMQEARAAASLVHPNIVQVYDVGNDGEHRYIAQEYIAGSNLRQYLSQPAGEASDSEKPADEVQGDQQLPLEVVLSIVLQVLAALHKSASCGIVHRDIKPENIMLTRDGDVKVADFGLARVLLGDDPQLTRAGTTLGTPMYMSPEQIQEGTVDIRSDLYSLGVTVYHMLCGSPPFTGETPLALAMKHVQSTVPDLAASRKGLPASIVEFVSRLLSKSPGDRFENPSAALEFLRKHRGDDLREVWPDQTVPLPGANVASNSGPLQATLMLQSKLRGGQRTKNRKRILTLVGIAALMIGMFLAGAAYTFELPHEMFRRPPAPLHRSIPKASSIKEQYKQALLHADWVDSHKWEAVLKHWGPPSEKMSSEDLMYYGLATIKHASVLLNNENYREEAENYLRQVIDNRDMDAMTRVIAYLHMAMSMEKQNKEPEMRDYVDQANQLAQEVASGDYQKLDEVVDLMPEKVSNEWFSLSQ